MNACIGLCYAERKRGPLESDTLQCILEKPTSLGPIRTTCKLYSCPTQSQFRDGRIKLLASHACPLRDLKHGHSSLDHCRPTLRCSDRPTDREADKQTHTRTETPVSRPVDHALSAVAVAAPLVRRCGVWLGRPREGKRERERECAPAG